MSETTIQVAGKHVTIRQRSPAEPIEMLTAGRYRHQITVFVDGKHRTFPFFGSVFDFLNRRDMLNKGELVEAFKCVVSDACVVLAGNTTPYDMKVGLDRRRRLNELGFSDDDMFNVEAELSGRS